jgi:hypothetical protein
MYKILAKEIIQTTMSFKGEEKKEKLNIQKNNSK